jgi:hypothetical protein
MRAQGLAGPVGKQLSEQPRDDWRVHPCGGISFGRRSGELWFLKVDFEVVQAFEI